MPVLQQLQWILHLDPIQSDFQSVIFKALYGLGPLDIKIPTDILSCIDVPQMTSPHTLALFQAVPSLIARMWVFSVARLIFNGTVHKYKCGGQVHLLFSERHARVFLFPQKPFNEETVCHWGKFSCNSE